MPSFPDRLKELRKLKNVTQKTIAIYLDMAERSYRRYEAGDLEPNHETTIKLADYFNVSTDYLLGRSDTPERN
jgi:transcriptional regulator with XRE-family HTH domain